MTREVSRENSQDALDKDPRATRPDQPHLGAVPVKWVSKAEARKMYPETPKRPKLGIKAKP